MTKTTEQMPKVEFVVSQKSDSESKLRLTINITDPESREFNADEEKIQENFLEHLHQSVSGFKKYSFNEEKNSYKFFYKNSESILKVLQSLKESYGKLYQEQHLEDVCNQVKYDQQISLAKRKSSLAECSYSLPDTFKVEGPRIDGSVNQVYRISLSQEEAQKLNLKTQDVFYKHEKSLVDSRSDEYQAVAAALYELFLGPDRVPATRVVYDKQGLRKGTLSAAFADWQSLSDFIEKQANENLQPGQPKFPADSRLLSNQRNFSKEFYYPEQMVHQLVKDGIVEVYAVCYFMANLDAHFDNVGYHNGKLCYLDFDKALSPLIMDLQQDEIAGASRDAYRKCAMDEGWDIDADDIGENFATPKKAKPFRWLNKNGFSFGNEYNHHYDKTPDLAKRVASAPEYMHNQFFTFLKIFLAPAEDILNCIKCFLKNEKHSQRIYDFILDRQQKLLEACFLNDEFCDWLLDNVDGIKDSLEQSFIDYYHKKTVGDLLSEDKIHSKVDGLLFAYDKFIQHLENSFEQESSCDEAGPLSTLWSEAEEYETKLNTSASSDSWQELSSIDKSDDSVEESELASSPTKRSVFSTTTGTTFFEIAKTKEDGEDKVTDSTYDFNPINGY